MKLVVANHKTNLSKKDILSYQIKLKQRLRTDLEIVICPSMAYLSIMEPKDYKLGSQNVSLLKKGNITGEVSASQLKELGTSYCIVGHSERRELLNETSKMANDKIKILLNENITPILCVGETKEQRSLRKTDIVIEKELKESLKGLNPDDITSLVIAYEPIWAIGTNLIPKIEEIYRTVAVIREILNRNFSIDCRILYGGSINSKNIIELEKIKNIDGYLIGSSSLNPEEFLSILNNME